MSSGVIDSIEKFNEYLDWNPKFEWGFKKGEYKKSYFCQYNMIIHQTLSEKLNCPYCCKLSKEEIKECKRLIKINKK
jgi:hypothetical protein